MEQDKISLKENLLDFLTNNPSSLQEIYLEFPHEKGTTIRGRLNENVGRCFKRIKRGVYLAKKGDAQALIIEGDAWKEIKEIEDNSIDAIITDSPYSCLNHNLKRGTTKKRLGKWSFKIKDIDKKLLIEMRRVLKRGGHFFTFLPSDSKDTLDYNNKFIRDARIVGFDFNKRFIWDKQVMGMGYNGRNRYEQIIFFSKGKRRMPLDLSIKDLLSHRRISSRKRIHETEKPIELIEDIIKFCSEEKEVILDPFAGSLVLAKASLNLGRNSISIEIDGVMIKDSMRKRNLR